jgi:glycosyltransferase involved in cell wall biosynthesis
MNSFADQEIPTDPDFPMFILRSLLCRHDRLDLPPPYDKPNLVSFHSTYIPVHAKLARKLTRLGIPYIICPRGGMTRSAVAHKGWKKRLGNLAFFDRLVARAQALHCLTHREASESSQWGRPTFVVGNGTHAPRSVQRATIALSPPFRMVFIGRLAVEHKGLDLLVDAAAMARQDLLRRGARIELHGPDYEGGAKRLDDRIARLGLSGLVSLGGPVMGEVKQSILEQADVFLHTSRWEGHPMAVLEALAYGVPCLLTPGTNMAQEVAQNGAGWKVEESAGSIAEGLRHVLLAGRRSLCQIGAKARDLATSQYSWRSVATRSLEAYRQYAA